MQLRMTTYHLAQINIARMKGVNINDPVMQEFVDNLSAVNAEAESSPGFVWRLKDETNDATQFDPYSDEQVIINVSVWESIEALEHFMYQTLHVAFLKRRREWFQTFGKAYVAMWWVPAGQTPTLQEAVDRLDELQKNGPSDKVFDFKHKFLPPVEG
jgi:Domain of unknown function (DUF3291)